MRCEVAPLFPAIDRVSWAALRCRVVNRAFGTRLTPAEIARELSDEDIDLLLALDRQDRIHDAVMYLRLLLNRG